MRRIFPVKQSSGSSNGSAPSSLTGSISETHTPRRGSLAYFEKLQPSDAIAPGKERLQVQPVQDYIARLQLESSESASLAAASTGSISEDARVGLLRRYRQVGEGRPNAPSSVFGTTDPSSKVPIRRRRLSMESQLDLIRSRPNPATAPATPRTAPRSNSAPKVRPEEDPLRQNSMRILEVPDSIVHSSMGPPCRSSRGLIDSPKGGGVAVNSREWRKSFSDWSSSSAPVSKEFDNPSSNLQGLQSQRSSSSKYLGARALAERLSKAIRGSSKASTKVQPHNNRASNTDVGAVGQSPEILPVSVHGRHSGQGRALDQMWQENSLGGRSSYEKSGELIGLAELSNNGLVSSFRDRKVDSLLREENERDILKSWLQELDQVSDGGNDDLEKRARAAWEHLEILDEEQEILDDQLYFLSENKDTDASRPRRDGDSILVILKQRIRKMHGEKRLLALQVATELRKRISEQAAARKVFSLMKREMDSYAKVMEKEKDEVRTNLEDEIARRELTWVQKLEKIRLEERWLREQVMNLEEEKGAMVKEHAGMASKEMALREKVAEFELQVGGQRARADRAEAEVDLLRKAYREKEGEKRELHKVVERLQSLCLDYETSIHSFQQGPKDGRPETKERRPSRLQKELLRLSSLETALRMEMEALRGETSMPRLRNEGVEKIYNALAMRNDQECPAKSDQLGRQETDLRDENNLLRLKLRLAVKEREDMNEAVRRAEEEIQLLKESVGRETCDVEEHVRGLWRTQHRGDTITQTFPMLQGVPPSRESTGLACGEDSKPQNSDSQHLESETQQSLQVPAGQFSVMNERTESMCDKLLGHDMQLLDMRNDAIRGLEHSLNIAGKTVNAQKARILRLCARNEELVHMYHAKESEVQDLRIQTLAEAESRKSCEQELDQLREQAMKCKQDLRAQHLQCKLLNEKLCSKEVELEQRSDEVVALEQTRDWLEAELQRLQWHLGDANQRATTSENQLNDKKERIKVLQADMEDHLKELLRLRDELPRVTKERDALHEEAEEMGREAFRVSAEVEVLRREVHKLDEDVMVKDGQISMLCREFEGNDRDKFFESMGNVS